MILVLSPVVYDLVRSYQMRAKAWHVSLAKLPYNFLFEIKQNGEEMRLDRGTVSQNYYLGEINAKRAKVMKKAVKMVELLGCQNVG